MLNSTAIKKTEPELYTLRLLEEGDSLTFFTLIEANRKRLEDFFPVTVAGTQTKADTENFIKERLQRFNNGECIPYVMTDKENNRLIGYIDVKNIDKNIPKAELGAFIDKEYEGKGISGLLMKRLIEELFLELGFRKLFLRTHSGNSSAIALAESCGFIREGTLRRDHKTGKGELTDLEYYGLLSEEILK